MTSSEAPALAALVRRDSRRRTLGVLVGRVVELPVVGPWFARLLRLTNEIPFVTARVTRLHSWLLRRSGGRLRRSWLFAAGQPVISLTTIGRKSGQKRSTAVACFVDGDALVVAGMNLGRVRHPAWALNLEANPEAQITVRGETIDVTARCATGSERARLWERWLQLQPSARAFEELAEREVPIFVLTRRAPTG